MAIDVEGLSELRNCLLKNPSCGVTSLKLLYNHIGTYIYILQLTIHIFKSVNNSNEFKLLHIQEKLVEWRYYRCGKWRRIPLAVAAAAVAG
jgi:hypothetical protein